MIKNGVPFDVAYSLDMHELLAYSVLFGKLENGDKEFDWDAMRFIER